MESLSKKKICFVVSSSLTVRAFLINHIKNLSLYFDIYLVGDFDEIECNELSELEITAIKSLPISRKIQIFKDLRALYELYSYIEKKNFDVVHSITPKAGLLAMTASFFAKIQNRIHIFTGQVWYTKKGIKRLILKISDKIVVWFSTQILVDGKGQMAFLIDSKIIAENKISVLAQGSISGVDIELFRPTNDDRDLLRQKMGFNSETIVILFLGRINRDKGIFELISAFKRLSKEFKNVFLLVVGFDEEYLIPDFLKDLPSSMFKFTGPTKTPIIYYQLADIFCLPSHREGFGTSLIEASSCELPIVCSDTYGLQDTIIENVTGLRHNVKNELDLYKQLSLLVLNKSLRQNLGINGRKYVLENFSQNFVTKAWVEYYKKLLNVK